MIRHGPTEFDFKKAIADERRADRRAAKAFIQACEFGSAEDLLAAVDLIHDTSVDGWRLAFKEVARLPSVSDEIKDAFLMVWIESKMLPLHVRNRRTLANALSVLLPGHCGNAMRVFRGASARERRNRIYGFSWTTRLEIARRFADHWHSCGLGGVILETTAPAEAVLLVREDEDYYDEGEVVVDPFRLGPIKCLERLASATCT